MIIIGIDLGTTNSLASVWRGDQCELIPNASGAFLTPSVVSIGEDGSILVGQIARDRLISHPESTVACFKRTMGSQVRHRLGEREFSSQELSSFLLRRLREDAETYLGEPVEEAVISVPAYFTERQRSATKEAARLAGLRVDRLINEPTAAALAGHIGEGSEDKVCLVFDLGGGTLDVSLVERFHDVVSVTAVSGDNHLGGADFDRYIAQGFCDDCKINFASLTRQQRELLLRQAECCKIALTTQEPVIMTMMDETISASLSLTNEWLIRKSAPLFRRMLAPVRKVFVDAEISLSELDQLVLVGGSSHMPAVRHYIAKTIQQKPVEHTQPDTAIALGAGICAGMKMRVPELREMILTDVCPFTLGVACYNESDRRHDLMSPIIERNSVLPSSKENIYYPLSETQTEVHIRIYQGESRYCRDNQYLGLLALKIPSGSKEEQAIRVRFTYDINGLLEVDAITEHGESQHLVVQNGSMSEEEVAQRLRELSQLKLHPRDQEIPSGLIARGERLFAATVGHLREQVAQMLDWYQIQLATQEPMRIAKASQHIDKMFDQVEAYIGDLDVPPMSWEGLEEESE